MKLSEIAAKVGLDAPPKDCEIVSLNALTEASSGELAYVIKAESLSALVGSKASAVLIPHGSETPSEYMGIAWPLDNPALAMAKISSLFATTLFSSEGDAPVFGEAVECHESVVVGRDVHIGSRVILHPGVVIGDRSRIGDDCIIYPNVTIYQDVIVGARCILHAGCVIGGDGFGFVKDTKGRHIKFHQTGGVELGDDVEFGSNSTIDRATFGMTRVGPGSKIDNLVQIGHNAVMGEHGICCSQAGVAGSVKVGNRVIFGPQAGSAGHVSIADHVVLAARAGVTKSITKPGIYSGFPAQLHRKAMKVQAWIRHLAKKH